MLEKKYFRHLMKAKYAAQSLNEQLCGSKNSGMKIIPKKSKSHKSDRWYLVLS